jgi:hypothetical protein
LRIAIDTVRGVERIDAHSVADLRDGLTELTAAAVEDCRGGLVPPLYQSGVRYRREKREVWKRPTHALRDGSLDCEDAATWRVGELFASRADPGAAPLLLRTGPRTLHVVVQRGDGRVEDPSAVLGMLKGRDRMRYGIKRLNNGLFRAGVEIPIGKAQLQALSDDRIGAVALGRSLDAAIDAADAVGALDAIGWGDIYLPRRVEVGLDTGSALDATQAALSAAGPYGQIAATLLSIGRKVAAFLLNGSHSPLDYFYRWAADNYTPRTTLPAPGNIDKRLDNLAALLANGVVPVYCSDSAGTQANILREFATRGWTGQPWHDAYKLDKLGVRKIDHYGILYSLSAAPPATSGKGTDQAQRLGQEESTKRTIKFLTAAKAFMRTYGGTEDYDAMIVDAIPVKLPGSAAAPATPPVAQGQAGAKLEAAAARNDGGTPTAATSAQLVTPATARQAYALDAMAATGAQGDWAALMRLAEMVDRSGRSSAVARAARAIVRAR